MNSMSGLFTESCKVSCKVSVARKSNLFLKYNEPFLQPWTHILPSIHPCFSGHSKRNRKIGCHLMQVQSIAECSKGNILQNFRPSLSYNFALRPLFCLLLSGRLRQALLYYIFADIDLPRRTLNKALSGTESSRVYNCVNKSMEQTRIQGDRGSGPSAH